ncbi:hypothetical protein IHV12_18725 [Fictibacillus sp. 7GRE50]|uniref:hypothetical protein n=1 Tax=Fictibacillus sp. 7GRE50 TaxID=2745878 RepID=UPI0018CDB2E1|nr:hypothetical protein [Fictibacillus sp. 7GRE50]MBH0166959.1 hypothetical protein [Fictibacillus sp. 7GRE50]
MKKLAGCFLELFICKKSLRGIAEKNLKSKARSKNAFKKLAGLNKPSINYKKKAKPMCELKIGGIRFEQKTCPLLFRTCLSL